MGTWIPLHTKAGVAKERLSEYLQKLYDNGKSQREIANFIGCHVTTIENAFKKLGLISRSTSEATKWQQKQVELSEDQHECLDGMLLGDGCIEQSRVSGRLTYGCKYRRTLYDIEEALPSMHFGPHWQSKKTECWHFKSSFYNNLKAERNRWYPNGKVVPEDVRITPGSCFWWFIGDGYQVDYGVQLCTDNFDDLSILIEKLATNGFRSHKTPSSNRLRIFGGDATKFLEWIKPKVIPEQYEYKWGTHRRQSG